MFQTVLFKFLLVWFCYAKSLYSFFILQLHSGFRGTILDYTKNLYD